MIHQRNIRSQKIQKNSLIFLVMKEMWIKITMKQWFPVSKLEKYLKSYNLSIRIILELGTILSGK